MAFWHKQGRKAKTHGTNPVDKAMLGARGMTTFVAGADGCPPGWVVVLADLSGKRPPQVHVFEHMAELLRRPELPGIIAVDMPIGLPDQVGPGGRGPEAELRTHLGDRQSSVFSMPSRRAVYAEDYAEACQASLETSEPPRKISKQAFFLFPKVRQIDEMIRNDPGLAMILKESHPEGAFMVMNGGRPLDEPKKVKSAIHDAGIALRKQLLMQVAGFQEPFLDQRPPKGVGVDDFIDACACAWVAQKLARGRAISFPNKPERDGHGIPMAIWA
jgi:predicted RNase H-like nuclease